MIVMVQVIVGADGDQAIMTEGIDMQILLGYRSFDQCKVKIVGNDLLLDHARGGLKHMNTAVWIAFMKGRDQLRHEYGSDGDAAADLE